MGEQSVAAATAPIVRMHRDAGQLRHRFFAVGVERSAGHHHAVAFDNAEVVDLVFQQLPRTAHQHSLGLQGFEQLQQAADVVDPGGAGDLVGFGRDQGARAVAAEDVCCDVEVTNDAPDCFPLGTTTVSFTATDCAGNSTSHTQTLTIVDTTAPQLFGVPTDITIGCEDPPALPVVTN